jgi:hypothetical protein
MFKGLEEVFTLSNVPYSLHLAWALILVKAHICLKPWSDLTGLIDKVTLGMRKRLI